jgi:CheY-like chemotaxis protein
MHVDGLVSGPINQARALPNWASGRGLQLPVALGKPKTMAEIEGDTTRGKPSPPDNPGERPPGSDPPTAERPRRSRILVIDDEPLLGQTLRLAFEGRHDVVVATSGRKGLELLEQDSAFDLVLCDLTMPDVSGMRVCERAAEIAPRLARRFVLMTGGAFTPAARQFLANHRGARLEKPFDMADVEAILDGLSDEP